MTSHSDSEIADELSRFSQIAGRTSGGLLRQAIEEARAGSGRVVLVSGPAGIGKTTLTLDAGAFASSLGFASLSGACNDLAYTSPLGPWHELVRSWRRLPELPDSPPSITNGHDGRQVDHLTLVTDVRSSLEQAARERPLVLVFEDMHWSDQESLDLLPGIAREIRHLPIVLLVTFCPDEITTGDPLHEHLPKLIRESDALRIDLRRLDRSALTALVSERYRLQFDCHKPGARSMNTGANPTSNWE